MKVVCVFAAFVTMAASVLAQTSPQPVRIGTFHKQSVVTAFYRSPFWTAQIKQKMAEHVAARSANDEKKVEELKAWGAKHQELAHQQLDGEAPITNIAQHIAGGLPEIAKKAQVSAIAADLQYTGSDVQVVDVTDQILDYLQADEATRKIVQQLRH